MRLIVQRERWEAGLYLQLGDDDLALAGAPLARARTFWRLSARFPQLSIHTTAFVAADCATTLRDELINPTPIW